MKQVLTLCFSFLSFSLLFGQSAPNFFKQINHHQIFLSENAETVPPPPEYLLFQLDFEAMGDYLRSAPLEGTSEAANSPLEIELPMPDGTVESFKIWESTPMHPDLAARYPNIKGYAGRGVTNPHHVVKLSHTPAGVQVFVPSEKGGSFISRYAFGQTNYYYCHKHDRSELSDLGISDAIVKKIEMENATPDNEPGVNEGPNVSFRGGGDGALVERRDYRFALAATGEYSVSHGGTTESVLATLMEATMLLNTVLERDADMRLFLIASNDLLVFLDPDTDPYTNATVGGALLGQNETVLNNIVGLSQFDVGHVFTGGCSDVGGVVSGSVCSTGKARGVTCHFSPNVAQWTLSIAAHEMGHQLDVGHTWNACTDDLSDQYHSGSAVEPGSGSTIVSYKGSCGSNNIPGNDNVHYCNGSVQEFWTYTHDGGGNFCPIITTTSNHHPVVTLDYEDGFYIPIRTPFELEGEATDEDGDPLTYAWEQYNYGPNTPLGMQNGSSPSFRVYDPSTNPKRVFPRLQTILNNGFDITELLPLTSRPLDFRLLVRDNNVEEGAGGLTWQDVSFDATETAGPFLVTYPNTSDVVWTAGEQVEVTWDVANTDNDLVKCQAVNILISTDGGYNFDYLVAGATPNDGSEVITVPELISNNVRLRIEASANIFFDLSNANFEIQPASEPAYAMVIDPQWQQVCVPENGSLDISVASIAGYDQPVELAITDGLPADVGVSFSNNPVMPGETTTLTVDMETVTADGLFEAELRSISDGDTVYSLLTFNIIYSDFSALSLSGPTNGSSNHNLLGEFEWTDLPQADFYDFQIATSPTFEESTIVDEQFGLTDGNFTSGVALEPSKVYYWRVRPSNECGLAEFTSPSVFQTFTSSCDIFSSIDVPIVISSIGLPVIESILSVTQNGQISDLNVFKLKGFHNGIQDIKTTLISPSGTEVVLFDNLDGCGNSAEFNFGMDDESPFPIECPPLDGLKYIPENPLSTFDGENTLGNWVLEIAVIDDFGDGGQLLEWGIEFCATVEAEHPFLVENDTIYVQPLDTRPIHNFDLFASDPDNPGSDLVFTVIDETDHGFLTKNGNPIGVGGTFNLNDLNAQNIEYTNTNGDEVYDFFTFTVTDGDGGLFGTPRFNIVIDENAVVDVEEKLSANNVLLFPNPASSELNVVLQQVLDSDAILSVTDVQGRLIEQRRLSQADQQINFDLNSFIDGVYFLTIRTDAGMLAKKFIVQH